MDSRELEMAMGNDYVIVPSYSEAILMDAVHFDEQVCGMDFSPVNTYIGHLCRCS
jgi:hypothetical protein